MGFKQSCLVKWPSLNFGHCVPTQFCVLLNTYVLIPLLRHKTQRMSLTLPVGSSPVELLTDGLVSPLVQSLVLPHPWQDFGVNLPSLKRFLAYRVAQ